MPNMITMYPVTYGPMRRKQLVIYTRLKMINIFDIFQSLDVNRGCKMTAIVTLCQTHHGFRTLKPFNFEISGIEYMSRMQRFWKKHFLGFFGSACSILRDFGSKFSGNVHFYNT